MAINPRGKRPADHARYARQQEQGFLLRMGRDLGSMHRHADDVGGQPRGLMGGNPPFGLTAQIVREMHALQQDPRLLNQLLRDQAMRKRMALPLQKR